MSDLSARTPEMLEDLLLRLTDRQTPVYKDLATWLQPFATTPLPAPLLTAFKNQAESLADALRRAPEPAVGDELLLALASANVDLPAVRDAFAQYIRRVQADYPDPAGLLRALGVNDAALPLRSVRFRLQLFAALAPRHQVWHESFGLGQIRDVDPLSDLIQVDFTTRQHFTLQQALTALAVAKSGSLVTTLPKPGSKQPYAPGMPPAEFDKRLAESFLPPLPNPTAAAAQLLVPGRMAQKDYDAWRNAAAAAATKAAGTVQRSWDSARSLDELKLHLEKVTGLQPSAAQIEGLLKLFVFAAPRPNQVANFSELLARLWELITDRPAALALVKGIPPDAYAWTDGTFLKATEDLAAKRLPAWFAVTREVKSEPWLIAQITTLPYRYWSPAEEVLADEGKETSTALGTFVRAQVQRGEANPDAMLWLWRRHTKADEALFTNPAALLRALRGEGHGEYIKARKELRRLLLEDEAFQSAITAGGTREGIGLLTKTIKSSSMLAKGEQQSLLVKLVRQFPEAKDLVAEKGGAPVKRMPKITSLRSFREREQELHDLINIHIPTNSAAISHARSYGDLSENFEFKAAKERQGMLMGRRNEIEKMLQEVKATDFSETTVGEKAVPGSTIDVQYEGQTKTVTYHLLGLWDSVPERNMVSYDAPLGQQLLGKQIGESITTPEGKTAKITAIRSITEELRTYLKQDTTPAKA